MQPRTGKSRSGSLHPFGDGCSLTPPSFGLASRALLGAVDLLHPSAVLHRAGYLPLGTAYIEKRLDARTLVSSLPAGSLSFPRDLSCQHLCQLHWHASTACPPPRPQWCLFRRLPTLLLLTPPPSLSFFMDLRHSSLTVTPCAHSPCSCSPTRCSLHLHQVATADGVLRHASPHFPPS